MSQGAVDSISLIAAFAVSALLTWWFSRSPVLFSRMVDLPNERSLHAGVLPRTGGGCDLHRTRGCLCPRTRGLSLVFSLGLDRGCFASGRGISLLNDHGEVPARYRLAAHLGAGILLLVGGVAWSGIDLPGLYRELPSTLSWFLTLGYLVWMINLCNFMDGMDGFAGGIAVFGFGALGVLGWQGDDPGFALATGVVVAAAAGFLLFNFPPARIFLGDLGSAVLGLLAATSSLIGTGVVCSHYGWPGWRSRPLSWTLPGPCYADWYAASASGRRTVPITISVWC